MLGVVVTWRIIVGKDRDPSASEMLPKDGAPPVSLRVRFDDAVAVRCCDEPFLTKPVDALLTLRDQHPPVGRLPVQNLLAAVQGAFAGLAVRVFGPELLRAIRVVNAQLGVEQPPVLVVVRVAGFAARTLRSRPVRVVDVLSGERFLGDTTRDRSITNVRHFAAGIAVERKSVLVTRRSDTDIEARVLISMGGTKNLVRSVRLKLPAASPPTYGD